MKKFICIILSMIIVFSAFSVTSFATYTPKAEEAIKNLDFEKGVSFKLTYGASETLIMHRKDNKLALELIHDGVDFRMIADGNTAYLYFTKFPFFYFKAEGIADELFPSEFFDDSFFIDDSFFVVNFKENYTKTVNGVTYNVEKYTDEDDFVYEFYLIDDELKIVESSFDTNLLNRLEILSTEVDDKEFRPPFFAINITPIINFFYNIISTVI